MLAVVDVTANPVNAAPATVICAPWRPDVAVMWCFSSTTLRTPAFVSDGGDCSLTFSKPPKYKAKCCTFTIIKTFKR